MPLYEFACGSGHRFEAIVPLGVESRECECGSQATRTHAPARIAMHTGHGVGNRSSGEPLSRGEANLAALHYGACIKDSQTPGGRRPPRTEGELSAVLAAHGKRRGTVGEFNQEIVGKREQKIAEDKTPAVAPPITEKEIAAHQPSEKTIERMKKRREWFRSKYDHGAIPKKEVPADVKPLVPTSSGV